jgi:cyanophycinase
MSAAILAGALSLVGVTRGEAQELPPPESIPVATPISGTLFIVGGGKVPEEALQRFVALAGGRSAHIAVVTTASETADNASVESRLGFWRSQPLSELSVIHAQSHEIADDPKFAQSLATATGVWFIGGHQERLTKAYLGTRTEKAIKAVLKRGGVVGGTSAGAAIMSPVMISGGILQADLEAGFGFLPGSLVDQHFLKRKREKRLLDALEQYPRLVGFGIEENTVLVVHERHLSVIGDPKEAKVVISLGAVGYKPSVTRPIGPGDEADLLALSRTAIARVDPRYSFDDEKVEPKLGHGTLIFAGGGTVPDEAAERFIEAAGGPDATIVVVTTANGDRLSLESSAVAWLAAAGAKDVHLVHPRTRSDAEAPALLALLKKAGGVWFTGGRQWRLVDALENTPAEKEFHEVLARGGVVGGSAGGASMMADYLVRGGPMTNLDIMAEGYEEGFGFLRGIAVDPFFTQRKRYADMARLKRAHPHLVGLGIDEGTALVVTEQSLEVLGENKVVVYDARDPADAEKGLKFLYAGDKYDLVARERLSPPRDGTEPPIVATTDEPEPQTPQACDSE